MLCTGLDVVLNHNEASLNITSIDIDDDQESECEANTPESWKSLAPATGEIANETEGPDELQATVRQTLQIAAKGVTDDTDRTYRR